MLETERGGIKYTFSDGIGKISADLAHIAARNGAVQATLHPRFRFVMVAGYKGVVAVDPTSTVKLSLRKSMSKYKSRTQVLMFWHAAGTSPWENAYVLKEMLTCDYKPDEEPYLSMMLQTFRALHLQELMGCLDETGTLEYVQVFVQHSGSRCHHPDNTSHCLVGADTTLSRARSDLNGDVYFVCWDPDLIPPCQFPPMNYTPAPPKVSDNDVIIEDIEEYFVNYIMNDSLGVICNAHVAFADTEPNKAMSNYSCKKPARLASIAVDFSNTSVAAEIPRSLHTQKYPDFMEKENRTTYESQCVLGKLYREVKDIAPPTAGIKSFTREVAMFSYDPAMEVEGIEKYIDKAFY
ncbi:hypothetical protein Dsin_011823 [Dipteronia sinensis]|uniref:RNA-dependent RNA polymerase n=1 Tax=Dipteronia sinensis TaxID=43782 RepID=A0AAE0E7C9_9ROSI|nr:hypothetical protein Dsin_011823 [Dipteronia sinensis]